LDLNGSKFGRQKVLKKPDPANPQRKILALHVEEPADRAQEVRNRMSKWYCSSSSSFRDGIKMRLIPPINNIPSRKGKMKMATLLMRQEALNSRLAFTTSWEFVTNL
jgi:hypothetical protein